MVKNFRGDSAITQRIEVHKIILESLIENLKITKNDKEKYNKILEGIEIEKNEIERLTEKLRLKISKG